MGRSSLSSVSETFSETEPAIDPSIYQPQRPFIAAYLVMGFFTLILGGIYGTLQALDKAGIDLYAFLPPMFRSYYVGLTIHGVVLGLMFVFFFNIGFLTLTLVHGLKRPLISRGLAQVTFWLSAIGLVTTLIPMLQNNATVLWTFYPPLRAHPAFYFGLTLIAVSTWTAALNGYLTWRSWKKEHPKERTPLMAFVTLAVWAMWVLASLGLAVGLLYYLFPWSFGSVENINPLLVRSLYWFTGHPVVYFWLLPAYITWYTMLPKQVGGKLFSESLTRLVFLLFLPLSIPTGFHHMYADPGIDRTVKIIHGILTFGVVFPSLVTAFTVLASIEIGARKNGGKGWVGWLLALPWFSNPVVAGQLLSLLIFATGGITGIINASYAMNLVIHNTMFVVGHFHTQVAGAVTLTIIAVTYWLVPFLTQRKLWGRKLAVLQVWSWFVGMAVMARGMHWMGLAGAPRRSFLTHAPYALFEEWRLAGWLVASGGVILLISGGLFLTIVAMTAWYSKERVQIVVPQAQTLHKVERMPLILDRITPWVLVTIVLIGIAWLPSLYQIASHHPVVPGWRLW